MCWTFIAECLRKQWKYDSLLLHLLRTLKDFPSQVFFHTLRERNPSKNYNNQVISNEVVYSEFEMLLELHDFSVTPVIQ